MIRLKDIIKEGVIEPLLEAETYNLKSKKTGKIVTFTNKDNYKDALKGGDYEEKDVVGHEIAHVEIFPTVEGYSTTSIIENTK